MLLLQLPHHVLLLVVLLLVVLLHLLGQLPVVVLTSVVGAQVVNMAADIGPWIAIHTVNKLAQITVVLHIIELVILSV
jgi:hypothetical protein